ncbi:minor tail protein [Streptomyces phage Alsaber]|uniref:Minor tail protein n=1 Tax=Streptomyces phage Alsaber TaxID=2053672 RepID=A0A2H4PGD9_9CAUD|nr:tail protein [Streptomyces phage Alsaber]ATW61301.1 minor tail protein [Streptomyces phage Alsaber]
MAQTSYPFDAQSVTETQYSAYFRELQDSGVVGSSSGTALKVTSAGTSTSLSVAIGAAVVRGHFYNNDSVATVTIAAADTAARTDLVVLKLDPAANSILLTVRKGTAGQGVPVPEQTATGNYELVLAQVAVGASVTSISAASVTDVRTFVGNRVRSWTTATRPATADARVGMLGYNTTTLAWEFWNGTAWTNLVQSVDWGSLSNKPGTFPPDAHTHDYTTLTNKPTTFPPSSHTHDWSQIVNEPATFPPSTHSHTWASITSKPTTFTPSTHYHGQYLEAGDTISWANGTKKAHSNSVSDGGPYYAVWVEGSGVFARNTSSIRFKENVRDYPIDPAKVLALRPVIYDRKLEEGKTSRRTDEFGLIAEEVYEQIPEIVNILDGEVDGLRYDLLPVAMITVLQDQQARIERLEKLVEELSK